MDQQVVIHGIWALVAITLGLLYRKALGEKLGDLKTIAVPGGGKAEFEKRVREVAEVIQQGESDPPDEVARRICAILSMRDRRILRALFDEYARELRAYRDNPYYAPGFGELTDLGLIETHGASYRLTPLGEKLTADYLMGRISDIRAAQPEDGQGR